MKLIFCISLYTIYIQYSIIFYKEKKILLLKGCEIKSKISTTIKYKKRNRLLKKNALNDVILAERRKKTLFSEWPHIKESSVHS